VNHSARMDPVVLEARRRAESGALGNVLAVNFLRNSEYTPYAGGPVIPPPFRKGSYPFQDLGVHALYLIEAFLGEIRKVDTTYFSTGKDPYLLYDEWRSQVGCERGVGQISLSWNTQPMLNELVIQGSKGTLFVDCYLQTITARRTLPGVPKPIQRILGAAFNSLSTLKDVSLNTLRFATGSLKPNPGIGMAVTSFYEALRTGKEPPIPASEGRRIVAIMEEVSARADEAKRKHDAELKSMPVAPARMLVTGAGGFLGKALSERLAATGEPVRVMLRRPSKELAQFPNLHPVYGDLGDAEAVDRAVAGVEIVYHVGATMKGWTEEFQRGTVWGTRNVIDACLKHGVKRMVHVSSLSVLDQAGHTPGVPVTESSPYEPYPKKRGAYTQTKLDAEKLVLEAVKERSEGVV
jgi:putative NADH-flavin reductase